MHAPRDIPATPCLISLGRSPARGLPSSGPSTGKGASTHALVSGAPLTARTRPQASRRRPASFARSRPGRPRRLPGALRESRDRVDNYKRRPRGRPADWSCSRSTQRRRGRGVNGRVLRPFGVAAERQRRVGLVAQQPRRRPGVVAAPQSSAGGGVASRWARRRRRLSKRAASRRRRPCPWRGPSAAVRRDIHLCGLGANLGLWPWGTVGGLLRCRRPLVVWVIREALYLKLTAWAQIPSRAPTLSSVCNTLGGPSPSVCL